MATKSVEERIQRLEDIHEIQNLMSRYEYLHTAGLHEATVEMFAKKTPGVSFEMGPFGVYEGAQGIQRICVDVERHGEKDRIGFMVIHTLTTPVIEVARDGKTAKGVWISPGHVTQRIQEKLQVSWQWVKYGVDFVKEDGQWKFWHFHMYGICRSPYDKSWVEAYTPSAPPPSLPDELKSNRPTTYHWEYSPTGKTENVPAPPEPYEIWDESTAYVK